MNSLRLSFCLLIGLAFSSLSASLPLQHSWNTPGISQLGLKSISFTLRNTSLKSVPLKIPNVMNPNLYPLSNSGVTLKIGQEIFFSHKRKRYLLLKVTGEEEGKTLDVPKLIRERKKELGLK